MVSSYDAVTKYFPEDDHLTLTTNLKQKLIITGVKLLLSTTGKK